ncbi:MAG: signal peptidase I [Gemmatimonadetes bacterium]|nr:signal peptidase I [Gemmatimonadota bacterium]
MAKKKTEPKPSSTVAAARGAPARGFRHHLVALVKGWGPPILIFLFFRTFLIEAYRIPSGSMIPTMLVGDWLFVNKLRFGPVIPFTSIKLPSYAEPERGNVVVFVSPPQVDQPDDPTPVLVKRLVAIGGDTVYMRDGVFHLNGAAQRQGYAASHNPVGDPSEVHPLYEWQHRFEVKGTRFGAPPAQPTHDNWGPLVIPPGYFMMLGDNRYQSKDSRYWGLVPRANIYGRPLFVYYSYNGDDSDRPLPFLTDIRWGRIGHWIE